MDMYQYIKGRELALVVCSTKKKRKIIILEEPNCGLKKVDLTKVYYVVVGHNLFITSIIGITLYNYI